MWRQARVRKIEQKLRENYTGVKEVHAKTPKKKKTPKASNKIINNPF